jgi:hypothetical protein
MSGGCRVEFVFADDSNATVGDGDARSAANPTRSNVSNGPPAVRLGN